VAYVGVIFFEKDAAVLASAAYWAAAMGDHIFSLRDLAALPGRSCMVSCSEFCDIKDLCAARRGSAHRGG